jgi:transcription elongation factor Elf1
MRSSMAEMTPKGAYNASMRTPTLAYGDNFICRHCGAEYLVSYTKLPIADSGSVYCDVCRRQMIQWNSSLEPSYKLVKRPDPI